MKTRIPVFLSLLLLGFMVTAGWGQIVAWEMAGLSGNEVSVDATTLASGLNTSTLIRGAGLNPASLSNGFSSNDFTANGTRTDAFTNNDYLQLQISSQSGYSFSLSTLDANFRRSSTGPNVFQWQYSLDGFVTAGTNIESEISFTSTETNGVAQAQIDLSGISELQNVESGTLVTIRLYGWGASSTAGTFAIGRLSGNDLAFGGTVIAEGVAAAPTFDPPGGTYYEPIDVVLSTTTPNGVIYYTDDGTDPDDQSTLYTEPIPLSSTTTLKAITYADELEPSSISTAEYIFPTINDVADVATLRLGAQDGTVYRLTGEAFLTFQQSFRNQKYIQDNTAGILIDDNPGVITTTYQRDDGITGLIGTLTEFGNMLQFNPEVDPGPATSSENTVVPVELTVAQFNADFETYEARLVKLLNVSFTETGTFTNGQVYGISDGLDAANFRCTFYDVDYIGTDIPQNVLHLNGLPNSRSDGDYITARDLNDFETPSDIAIDAGQSSLPQVFALHQNYPNPFNPTTAISYQLPEASEVQLIIYNLLGQKVTTLVSERQPAGHYTLQWDASGMVSGVYLYKLQTDNGFSQTRKLVLMK
jgi:hypothetical protein